MTHFIHPTADVATTAVGDETKIWQFCVVLKSAKIGRNCNINCHCFIENDVIIGDNVTIKSGVYLWDGVRLGNNVFVGPNVTFTNDLYPRSKKYPAAFLETHVLAGASIGAAAVILPGITIGENAIIGAGTVVIESVPANVVVLGNPGRVVRPVTPSEMTP